MQISFSWRERMLFLDGTILSFMSHSNHLSRFLYYPDHDKKMGCDIGCILHCITHEKPELTHTLLDFFGEPSLLGAERHIPEKLILERLQLLWLRGSIAITNQLGYQRDTKIEDPLFVLRTNLWETSKENLKLEKLRFKITNEGKKRIEQYKHVITWQTQKFLVS